MFKTFLVAVCLLLISVVPAAAGSITVEGFFGVAVAYHSPYNNPGEFYANVIGSARVSGVTGLAPGLDGSEFDAYCIDIDGDFEQGTADATAASMSTWYITPYGIPASGRRAAWLYNEYATRIPAASNSLVARTALQMAIWNVLYDTDATVSTGLFYVSPDPQHQPVRDLADEYLRQLFAHPAEAAVAEATWIQFPDCDPDPVTNDGCMDQDLIGPLAATATPVPEPTSMALLATALTGMGVARWRRKPIR